MKLHSATIAALMLGAAGLLCAPLAKAQTGAGDPAKVLRNAQRVKQAPAAAAAHSPKAAEAKPGKAAPELAPSKGGKRDPFVSPIREEGSAAGPVCTGGGKRCLQPEQVILRGVVKSPDGFIALVAVPTPGTSERAYFLRANDAVFNGYVLRITADSVVFKQNVIDKLGRTGEREVVKTLGPAAPAGAM